MNIITISNIKSSIDEKQTVWLNLEDISKGLGFTQIKNGVEYVRWERVNQYLNELKFPTNGENGFIPENIFYRLAMKANNEVADKFQEKIANEVLPSIRQNGGYIANQENLSDADIMAKALMIAQTVIDNRNKQIEQLKPKAEFYDAVAGSKDAIDIGTVARVLGIKGIGRNKLFEILREKGILMHDNQPYQKYIDCDYFRTIEQKYSADGEIRINIKTLVFQKGLNYIRKLVTE